VSLRPSTACLVGLLILGGAPVQAQLPRPLSPIPEDSNRVLPFFDGWSRNPDGTVSFSFGYSTLNRGTVEIPLGPDNFITPKELDGRQPTSFPPVTGVTAAVQSGATNIGAGAPAAAGIGTYGNLRERGTFTVTVPGDFKGDVVWTLRYRGQSWSVPARTKTTSYELSWPMAMGSVPPLIRFEPNGRAGRGPTGIEAAPLEAKVGQPIELAAWLHEDGVHEPEPIPVKRDVIPSLNATWFKHSGPVAAQVQFNPPKQPIAEAQGKATTTAVFSEPGDYVVRLRGDSFGNIDSAADDQCCWTNGYWKVHVTR
jgi:hypothetical protein